MVTDTGKLAVRIGAWLTDGEARKAVARHRAAAVDALAARSSARWRRSIRI